MTKSDEIGKEEEPWEAVYIELKGWNMNLTNITNIKEAPKEVHDYISYLEKELNTPISIVSVGPDRSQTLIL